MYKTPKGLSGNVASTNNGGNPSIWVPRRTYPTAAGDSGLGELCLTLDRPSVFSAPTEPPGESMTRVWVNYGFFNDSEPTNDVWYFDVSKNQNRYFFAVATLVQDAPRVELQEWELAHGASKGSHTTSNWPTNGLLPATFALCIGKYNGTTGQVSQGNGGSIWLSAPIGNISQSDHITFDRYFEVNRNGIRYALSANQGV